MPVNVIGTLKPKNNGKFPVAEAVDIKVTDDLRLDEALENKADLSSVNFALNNKADKTTATDLQEQIDVESSRIDQIISLPDGSTTADAELVDIRVGYDGTSYSSAGDAVRSQVSSLKKDLSELPKIAYNKNNNITGYYLSSSGEMLESPTWNVSEKFDVTQGPITYSGITTVTSAAKACFFDESDGFVSYFVISTSETTITDIPAGAKYVRFSVHNSDVDSFMCEYQFLLTYSDSKNASVDMSFLFDLPYLKPQIKQDEITKGYYLDVNGEELYQANWGYTAKIQINPSKPFEYSGISTASSDVYCHFYDANGDLIADSGFRAVANVPTTVSDIPSNAKYVVFSLFKDDYSTFSLSYKLFDTASSIQSIWNGKNYISHGDSITYYDGHEYPSGGICKGYQSVMNDSIGFSNITNQGRSGYSMADRAGHNGIVSTILATNHSAQDLCSIFAGTNDFKLDIPIGTIGAIGDTNLDRTTFYGAYRTAIEHILGQKPSIRLVLFTPLQRNNDGYDVNTTNAAGHKLIDYVDAVKAVGRLYGLPVCDLYASSGFTQLTLSTYTIDGLHPNDAGHKRIGDYLVSFVNSVGN